MVAKKVPIENPTRAYVTLRDQFAVVALNGLLASGQFSQILLENRSTVINMGVCEQAWDVADRMMKLRDEHGAATE